MPKQQITIERGLKSNSPNIIWSQISKVDRLEQWMADSILEQDGLLVFTWGNGYRNKETRSAKIIKVVKHKLIRFQWLDEEDPEAYFEFKMEKSDITDDYILVITDFAAPDDIDTLKSLWNDDLDRLRLSSGL
ncbi:MAG: START-like domain-containing protein [Prevotella sp.]